jgi:hypothetical protein
MRERFAHELAGFLDFLGRMNLDAPTRFNGEIAYVNSIVSGSSWQTHAEANRVFRQFHTLEVDDQVVTPEDLRWFQRFTFNNRQGEPTGRLYAQAEPALSDTGLPMFNLTLTARGGMSEGVEDLMDFMQAGRERIVRVFDAMTTPAMHDEWVKVS